MIRAWLRKWLGIELIDCRVINEETCIGQHRQRISDLDTANHCLQNEIKQLRAELTRLSIAQYVPPQQPEPERKVVKTRNFREYSAIVEQEQEKLIERELNAI